MSANATVEIAPAKLNLALRVGALRPDGYHPLESLMVALSAPVDRVSVRVAVERRVTCPGVAERDNLAWKALEVLAEATGHPLELDVTIDKEIPSGAGLGGGSSDAAAVMRAARRIHDLTVSDDELEVLAAAVGSDVPFFIRGGAQWARGRGEMLEGTTMPEFHAVVCWRGPPLATPSVYARFDELPAPEAHPSDPPPLNAALDLARWARNDLWPAALDLRPDLRALSEAIATAGAARALLCGSGAAVCGLFADRSAAEAGVREMSQDARAWLSGPYGEVESRHDQP